MGKLTAGDIPGYAEAVSREQQNREIAYLDVPFDVCGVKLRQMTPRTLAALFAHGSPFVCGGAVTLDSVVQLLWACSEDYRASRFSRWRFIRSLTKRIKSGSFDFEDAIDEIEDFIDVTFQDAPRGGARTIPYASQIAWLEFTLSGEPWRWSRERILSTPLRVIYQQMRCADMSKGTTPINPSDRIRADWIDSINNRATGDS